MAIAFTKYVDITSGVGGVAQVARRELIGRLFTTNPLVPTKSFGEFTDLESVGDYFGTSSEEYKRAQFYFSFISKRITRARKISFARWADADTAPLIFGAPEDQVLSTWQSIADGAVALTLGPDTEVLTGINFTGAASLSDVASILQSAIQAANVAAVWSGATVVYDAVEKRFNLTGGATGNLAVDVADAGSGTEIGGLLGWIDPNAILSNGVVTETITDVLTESAAASNNFGSFLFMPALTLDENKEAATWADAQNVRFMFVLKILEVDAQTYYDELQDIGATGIMVEPVSVVDEYHEMPPMILLASTDYTLRNSNVNYMYNQFTLSPAVTATSNSNALDALRINYYGQTQQAGRLIEFFQRGDLQGQSTDPIAMNVFGNEIWFKDAAGVAIMNTLLALEAIPANNRGEAIVRRTLQSVIEEALNNGVVSVGKALNNTQKEFITSITGDELAWQQVSQIGYVLEVSIVEDQNNPGEFVAEYVLIYSKADTVRKVEGTHTLI